MFCQLKRARGLPASALRPPPSALRVGLALVTLSLSYASLSQLPQRMVENSSSNSSSSISQHHTATPTAPSTLTADAGKLQWQLHRLTAISTHAHLAPFLTEPEPAIGGYSHKLSPTLHHDYDDKHVQDHDQDQDHDAIPASANALHRLRGRLECATGASQLRSASAPNLGREEIIPDTQVTGVIKRSNTQINSTTPSTRPPLISKKLLEPSVPVGKPPGWRSSLLATVRYSWLNVLLIAVPVSSRPRAQIRTEWRNPERSRLSLAMQIAWAMDFSHQSATTIFVTSFIAIVPLAALLGFATEELALRVGDGEPSSRVAVDRFQLTCYTLTAFGGLLNATFGNAVELIISIRESRARAASRFLAFLGTGRETRVVWEKRIG